MFRKAVPADCGSVYALICDMEQHLLPYGKFSEIYERQMNDERYCCLVCEQDNRVIGALNLRFEQQLHHAAAVAEIMEFVIEVEWRNRGIGKAMLGEACALAAASGCIQIEVACNQLREDTHRFYLREGMHNFHFKFSKTLTGEDTEENSIGR